MMRNNRTSTPFKVFAVISAVVAVYQFAELLYRSWVWLRKAGFNDVTLAVAALGLFIIFAAGLAAVLRYFLRPLLARDFGLPAQRLRRLSRMVLDQTRSYQISASGASARFVTTMVFAEEPAEADCVDMFDVEGKRITDEFRYKSGDSVELRREYLAGSRRLKIYWVTKTRIVPFVPYVHDKEFFVADQYDSRKDGGYILDILVDAATGQITFDVTTHVQIKRAVVVKYPRFRRLKTNAKVFHYASSRQANVGPAPQVVASNRVRWTGSNLEVGSRYGLVIFFRTESAARRASEIRMRGARYSGAKPN